MPRFDPMPSDFSAKCVETVVDGGPTAMDPVPFTCSPDQAFAVVEQVVRDYPRTEITETADGRYLDSIFRTKWIRWKDRVQLEVDPEARVIHFQSYSTPSYAGSDLGANRKRMEDVTSRIRAALPA